MFSDVPTDISVTKTARRRPSCRRPAQSVDFTFTVTNNLNEPATITVLADASSARSPVTPTARSAPSCPPAPAPATSRITRTVSGDAGGQPRQHLHRQGRRRRGQRGHRDRPTTIVFTDVPPDISVTKTADRRPSCRRPAGASTFTFTVTNNITEPATITILADYVYGTLTGDADCQVGTVLPAWRQPATSRSTRTVQRRRRRQPRQHLHRQGRRRRGQRGHRDRPETIVFSDVPPDISVTKTADATTRAGDRPAASTFTFTVTNNLNEPATITALSDSVYGPLAGDADCQVGTVLRRLRQPATSRSPARSAATPASTTPTPSPPRPSTTRPTRTPRPTRDDRASATSRPTSA